MLHVIINLLTLKALSTPVEIYAGLGFVWLLMLTAGLASVVSRNSSGWLKVLWFILLIGLPVAGMMLYCLYCLWAADYDFLKVFGLGGRRRPDKGLPKRSVRRVKSQP